VGIGVFPSSIRASGTFEAFADTTGGSIKAAAIEHQQ
jgi:hypothetical protein